MVQELSYLDSYSSNFPMFHHQPPSGGALRHQGPPYMHAPSATGLSGYGVQQPTNNMLMASQQYNHSQDYSNYMDSTGRAQQTTCSPVQSSAGWSTGGMYAAGPVHTPRMDEWGNGFVSQPSLQIPPNQHSPGTAYPPYRSPDQLQQAAGGGGGGGGGSGGFGVSPAPQACSQSPMPSQHMQPAQSPSPSSIIGAQGDGLSPGSPGAGGMRHQGQQNPRVPYDWMKKQNYQSMPLAMGKTRTKDKYRIVYSEYQKVELEKEYLYSKYITIQRKAELSRSIGLSERQVKIWFQNRRAKERKQKRKMEEALSTSDSSDKEHIKVETMHEVHAPHMHSHAPH
ncbi:hypothetical protein CAPTEDRAFT_109027 [Capitella teleta]|uniref:Caudal protein n=1 Tax=Capitella teleta TaxID=283909 RepID=R7TXI6_CAPTE|nr:hypothetical protein CAPTEDRAFT_109027 [Capitella teleta]|eukprot:ELT98643.1 hypothetical protein CAPTEDRAFT_109027 [Capitella teleta]